MSRLAPLVPEKLSAEQKKVYDDILAGPRGGIGGPFAAWLRSPQLADRAQKLGEFCRFGTSLPKRLSELAILMTARHWTAQFEWYAHARMAREAKLDETIIEAIRTHQRPAKMADDEAAIYDFCNEAYALHYVTDATYARAIAQFGEATVVELVGVIGYYCLVSLTLNIFKMPLPEGEKEQLK